MKQHDDYVSGPHHYWFQFVGGFVFGAGFGAYLGYDFFESRWLTLLFSLGAGFSLAFSCGRWGERVWCNISEWVRRW